jgi:1-deoxy-D-xylulose-5-phosphate reductoisomerase
VTKTVAVLGSTGSIGTQTLDVARFHGFRVAALTANASVDAIEAQAREFRPGVAAMRSEAAADLLRARVAGLGIRVLGGGDGVREAAAFAAEHSDVTCNAIVGRAGLPATLEVLGCGGTLALANKESIVCAGERVTALAKANNAAIIPVDSEHTAIFQCLRAADGNRVRKIILTASGGPFRGKPASETENLTAREALRHPTWNMGAKITVDSATLMNKGFEFIEAVRLFGLAPEQIEVVVHPQSVLHSAVEFADGSVIAQLSSRDMRTAIQYALTYPERLPCPAAPLGLTEIGNLTFEKPDSDAFPCLALAMKAAPLGDEVCGALNDANEDAVARFLRGEIRFGGIYEFVAREMEKIGLCL